MIRVTTNGTLRGYKSNLMRASNTLNNARNKVLTKRNFSTYAEDPAAATKAFRLRRHFSRTSDQLSNTTTLVSKFESAWGAYATVTGILDNSANEAALRANNDPTGVGRLPLSEVMRANAESIAQTLNLQYGGNYLFSGTDGLTVPFSWDSSGRLLYRGISVDDCELPAGLATKPTGTPPDPGQVTAGGSWDNYYAAYPDYAKLVGMTYETMYVDVGAGLSEANGSLVTASAFNGAINGLSILGFGIDEDGDPKNAVSIMIRLGELYDTCEEGSFPNEDDQAEALRLSDKLQAALDHAINQYTNLDGKSRYLKNNQTLLEDNVYSLNEQILDLEQCDLADAITDFSWAQYCYNAALKVGNSILEQSLLDYMN